MPSRLLCFSDWLPPTSPRPLPPAPLQLPLRRPGLRTRLPRPWGPRASQLETLRVQGRVRHQGETEGDSVVDWLTNCRESITWSCQGRATSSWTTTSPLTTKQRRRAGNVAFGLMEQCPCSILRTIYPYIYIFKVQHSSELIIYFSLNL